MHKISALLRMVMQELSQKIRSKILTKFKAGRPIEKIADVLYLSKSQVRKFLSTFDENGFPLGKWKSTKIDGRRYLVYTDGKVWNPSSNSWAPIRGKDYVQVFLNERYHLLGRLVLKVWDRKPKSKEIVVFRDGDTTNCSIKNLQWVHRSEEVVLFVPPKGKKKKIIWDERTYWIYKSGKVWSGKTGKYLKGNTGLGRFTKGAKRWQVKVPELVLTIWNRPKKKGETLRFKDGDTSNHRLSNLEWVPRISFGNVNWEQSAVKDLANKKIKGIKFDKYGIPKGNYRRYIPIKGNGKGHSYYVYENGNIWNPRTRKLLKPKPAKLGYFKTALGSLHRLILTVWVRPPKPGEVARHKDGNPAHNHYSNLEWGTHKENEQDKRRHGTYGEGEGHSQVVLKARDVIMMRTQARKGKVGPVQIGKWASKFGLTTWGITDAIQGGSWKLLNAKHPPVKLGSALQQKKVLTGNDAVEIRALANKKGLSDSELAGKFGVSTANIRGILEGKVFSKATLPPSGNKYSKSVSITNSKGYEFVVYSCGKIWSVKKGKWMTPTPGQDSFVVNMDSKTVALGKVILESFGHKQPRDKKYLVYLDGDGKNCQLRNLKWGTLSEAKKVKGIRPWNTKS